MKLKGETHKMSWMELGGGGVQDNLITHFAQIINVPWLITSLKKSPPPPLTDIIKMIAFSE